MQLHHNFLLIWLLNIHPTHISPKLITSNTTKIQIRCTYKEDSTCVAAELLAGCEATNFRPFRSKLRLGASEINKNTESTTTNPFQPIATVTLSVYKKTPPLLTDQQQIFSQRTAHRTSGEFIFRRESRGNCRKFSRNSAELKTDQLRLHATKGADQEKKKRVTGEAKSEDSTAQLYDDKGSFDLHHFWRNRG